MDMIDRTPAQASHATMDALWRDHYVPLRQFCAVVAGSSDADDLAADTFLRCRDRLASGRILDPRGYLMRSAVNGAHNVRRSRERERRRNVTVTGVQQAGDRPELGYVRDAVRELSPRQRAVLYLAYWEDQTESAIAEILGLHVGTVRRHLHRAHQTLRKALQ